MKIISGRLKGRLIPTIKNPKYRPSTGKLKEAMFSILSSMEKDFFLSKAVLDLFAGTGSLGVEALSRGAAHVTLVDIEIDHIKALKDFATKIGEAENITSLRLDATNLPISYSGYDIVFMDPPYSKSFADKSLRSLAEKSWLNPGAIIIIELESKEVLLTPDIYNIINERIIGKAKLVILEYVRAAI